MKQVWCFIFLLFSCAGVSAQHIVAAEYFFDLDPGPGLGTQLATPAPAPAVTFSANISTANLSHGFHVLGVRAKDADNKWGPVEWRGIYVSALASNVGEIVAAEFFFDHDPGPGAGTGLGVATPGHMVQLGAVIPINALQPGFHTLVVRTRDANGLWGFFESRAFYVMSASTNAAQIIAAEYYIDNDPGVGNGTGINVGPAGNSVALTALIPVTNLSSGFHTMAIRVKNADGEWGIVETRGFYLNPVGAAMGIVREAEYFLDTDPGPGNGSPLTISTPGNSVSQNYFINIPVSTTNGQHLLGIRVKDANGIWGQFELHEFTVNGFPLPLNWISFSAREKEGRVVLQWKTANENNTSHFDVERSVNGIDFTRIGEVSAKGQAENTYDFTDATPAAGLNYYRLKQVDMDGMSRYSSVTKIYFGSAAASDMRLYPIPAVSNLTIEFDGKGREVFIQVYNAAGQVVMNERMKNTSPLKLGIGSLINGSYWIVVSDGIVQRKGKFVKQ